MSDIKRWAYNFLIPLIFLAHRRGCSAAEDYSVEVTFEPEGIHLETLTTKSTFNGDSGENEHFSGIQSKSIEADAQKFNSAAIYSDMGLNGHNQLQERMAAEQNSEGDAAEHLTANGSNDSKDWSKSHKKLARSAFEKHKAHHRKYRRFGHKSHKRNFSKYKKNDHAKNRKRPSEQHLFNLQPYYQGQMSYYDTNSADKSIYPPAKTGSHQYQHHRGHHINRMDAYNRNSKWPHLYRVQYQLYEDEKEDDLPPYIRKYNRRNKQLLDLLEGTMPPPTPPPQPTDSKANKKREKFQHRYHNHKNPKWIMEDLFEEQRANPNKPNVDEDQYMNDSAVTNSSPAPPAVEDELKLTLHNDLPGEDVSVSFEETYKDLLKSDLQHHTKNQQKSFPATSVSGRRDDFNFAPKPNTFIYHRVDVPRVVGAGASGPKKQRLPFVAITDRRLETAKIRSKDFEQNHQPMP